MWQRWRRRGLRIGFVPHGGRIGDRVGRRSGWFGGGRIGLCGAGEAVGLATAKLFFGAEPVAVGGLALAEELGEHLRTEGVRDEG